MPVALSRKRCIDAVQVTPEKRRRVSAGFAQTSPQDPFRIEVRCERDEVVGPCDWHKIWAKAINCSVHVQFGQGHPTHDVQIGKCHSLFIERERIRYNFQAHMKHRSSNTAFLASALFDETGCLKPEFTNSALRSGSGLWNHELSDGNIFVIESIEVPQDGRYGDITSMLVERMLQEASRLHRKHFFAFTLATRPREIDSIQSMDALDFEGKPIKNSNKRTEQMRRPESFWRANGFRRVGMTRWFAWSSEASHPARCCPPSADFDLTAARFFSTQNQHGLLHTDVLKDIHDEDCVELFREAEKYISSDDLRRIDAGGNTLLHLAALSSKPQLLSWLMANCPPEVRRWRNFDRKTPLEALISARAEQRKTLAETPRLTFEGHDDASVECHLQLCSFLSVTQESYQQLKFDCSCMRCFGGFLSPRAQVKLIAVARKCLENNYDSYIEREKLVKLVFLESERLSDTIKHDLQELFLACMQQIFVILNLEEMPTAELIFRRLVAAFNFSQSQIMMDFILENGVVESAIAAVIESASLLDDLSASGQLPVEYVRILEETPSCCNDDQWALVRARLLSTEGNHRRQSNNLDG